MRTFDAAWNCDLESIWSIIPDGLENFPAMNGNPESPQWLVRQKHGWSAGHYVGGIAVAVMAIVLLYHGFRRNHLQPPVQVSEPALATLVVSPPNAPADGDVGPPADTTVLQRPPILTDEQIAFFLPIVLVALGTSAGGIMVFVGLVRVSDAWGRRATLRRLRESAKSVDVGEVLTRMAYASSQGVERAEAPLVATDPFPKGAGRPPNANGLVGRNGAGRVPDPDPLDVITNWPSATSFEFNTDGVPVAPFQSRIAPPH